MNNVKNISPFNQTSAAPSASGEVKNKVAAKAATTSPSDFAASLDEILNKKNSTDLNELKISKHAQKRIDEREISFSGDEYVKVQNAVAQLRQKGGNNSLIITDKAAYVVDVGSNKLVTAMNRQELKDNVFTKIDSTVVLPD